MFFNFLFVILPFEFSWLESYLDNDTLWLEDALNWEEAFDLALSDFILYNFFTVSSFFNNHFFLDSFVKISFLDVLLLNEVNSFSSAKELYDLFIWDVAMGFSTKYFPNQLLFYTDYQDFIAIILYFSPELTLAFADYLDIYWYKPTINHAPSAVFDIFQDSINSSLTEFTEYLIIFVFFSWLVLLFVNTFNLFKWASSTESYMVRFNYYIYSISRESRLQFEVALQIFFFFVFYWSMLVATFDDDKEEFIEIFDTGFFYFFLFLIGFLLYKYSLHYFAFLEASVSEGRSASFIAKQFFRDFVNTFALFLRFFILLFRLNVYDTLDDFYDSYYIFVGDFDSDEYINELFFSYYAVNFYDFDTKDDGAYSLEDENEFFLDLFYIYFICWAKFFTFIFFILEEILRLSLGFYICYLIVFEVHSVNCSYVEDLFFFQQKFRHQSQTLGLGAQKNFFKGKNAL